MPSPKISVVIPAFNAAGYIEETLRSVKRQTRAPYEILVIDDFSTDGTVEIAENFASRVIRNEKNMGVGYTRQHGAEEAKGDFVAFLSSDDVYEPNFLESSTKYLNEKAATFTDYFRVDEQTKPFETYSTPQYETQEEFKNLIVEYALEKNMFVNFSSVIIPKWIFKRVHFENLRYGEDLLFLLDTVIEGLEWNRIPYPLVRYRVYKGMGTFKVAKDYQKWLAIWNGMHPRLMKLGVSEKQFLTAKKVNYQITFQPLAFKIKRKGRKFLKKYLSLG